MARKQQPAALCVGASLAKAGGQGKARRLAQNGAQNEARNGRGLSYMPGRSAGHTRMNTSFWPQFCFR